MYLKLVRQSPEGEWLRGKLYMTPPSPLGKGDVTMVYVGETIERTSKAVLPGVYPVQVTMSPKFQRLLPLLSNVPGRTGIRIHIGTRPEHSSGCILVPNRTIERELTHLLLTAQNQHEPITLTLTNSLPDSPYE